MDCPELISAFLESKNHIMEKPESTKRKSSTEVPETEEEEGKAKKKKDMVGDIK